MCLSNGSLVMKKSYLYSVVMDKEVVCPLSDN